MNLTREDMKQNRQHQRERKRKTWDPYFPHNKICSLQQHWLRDQHQLQPVLGVSTETKIYEQNGNMVFKYLYLIIYSCFEVLRSSYILQTIQI